MQNKLNINFIQERELPTTPMSANVLVENDVMGRPYVRDIMYEQNFNEKMNDLGRFTMTNAILAEVAKVEPKLASYLWN